jgi:hypothetical protein
MIIKSRKMRWTGNEARKAKERNEHRKLMGKP